MIFEENEKLELKSIFTTDIKKEVIAFTNTKGGVLYIGVNDQGEVIGLQQPDEVSLQLSSSLREGIRPDVTLFTSQEHIKIEDKAILQLRVQEGTRKPYYLADKGLKPSGVYVRQGTASVQASEDAIRNMIKQADGDSYEDNISLNQSLQFKALQEEMDARHLDFTPVQQKSLGIINSDDLYTKLGLIVSDECKHTVKIAVFQGEDKSVFKDRKEIGGSIFTQLKETYTALNFFNKTEARFEQLLRIDSRDYPLDALREALLNALIHRDYSLSGSTFINIYSDRMEFLSLGGLVPDLTIEAAMAGASQARNEKLAALFYRMRLIESYGIGIGKILSAYKNSSSKPTFDAIPGAFRVILPNLNTAPQELSINQQTILQQLEQRGRITRAEVEQVLNLKYSQANQTLQEMLKHGLIIKVGSSRSTHYIASKGKTPEQ